MFISSRSGWAAIRGLITSLNHAWTELVPNPRNGLRELSQHELVRLRTFDRTLNGGLVRERGIKQKGVPPVSRGAAPWKILPTMRAAKMADAFLCRDVGSGASRPQHQA